MLLRFLPIPKKVIWGKSNFFKNFGFNEANIGELWMIGSENKIINFNSITLSDFSKKFPKMIFGNRFPLPRFPILIKYISTSDWLSIQVHPDDKFAIQTESEPWGKTEMWFFLETEKNAKIVCGLKKKVTKEEFISLINNSSFNEILNYVDVSENDWVLIKPGVVHAIGPEITLLEIQMNSDLTYRIFDWGRMDLDGKPRKLDIEKALKVINFQDNLKLIKGSEKVNLVFPTFTAETIEIGKSCEIEFNTSGNSFNIIIPLNNSLIISNELINKYETILITADHGKYKIRGNNNDKFFLIKMKGD
ncbi:MAG: class I mannose-6-phosphate isomerase [Caldisericia bacterium]|jgi:mannose-6-phosphate isomerase|nr:class I mannose-6-phosphate isomerase [Caldisericia bacterium]HRR06622.1 class I mannose-6-phosphate isomerase [Victivallales bacterium]MDD3427349.1 class I mannose-6-phosphate isomerase [Caldisericia bacterium]MDD5688774.1 class I mannose-6-phosphate isomerase [Caldisericia bacterium]HOJ15571.1 class I mannose-6-phosphate isomerase [Caldisericia bacterium]